MIEDDDTMPIEAATATPPPEPVPVPVPAPAPDAAPKPRRPRAARRPGPAPAAAPPPAPRKAKELARDLARAALLAAARGAAAAARTRTARQAVSVGTLLALFAWASVLVRDEARADIRHRVSKASLAATAPPKGLAREAIEDLAAIPIEGRSFSVYDESALPAIAAAYRALPWVRDVRSIQVLFPAVVRFDVLVRRPVAGLAHAGQSYLLDEEGVLLPRRCYEPNDPAALRLPTIVNAPFGRRRLREGQRLEDVPLKHGIAVALQLQAERFDALRQSVPIAIDVSNVDGRIDPRRSEIVVTAGGTVIEWGRSSLAARPDIPVEEKIEKLRSLLDRDPALARLAHVRLQFDDLEWRERAVPPPGLLQ